MVIRDKYLDRLGLEVSTGNSITGFDLADEVILDIAKVVTRKIVQELEKYRIDGEEM